MPISDATLPPVRIAGFLNAILGLGETGRLVRDALAECGVFAEPYDHPKPDVACLNPDATPLKAEPSSLPGITLLSLNGEHFAEFDQMGGRALLERDYVIAIWFWETEVLPPHIEKGFNYVDEVWTASSFVQNTLTAKSGGIPVNLIPHPIREPSGTSDEAHNHFPFDNRFLFLFSFDYNSCIMRKNPDGVCEAFAKAFPEPHPDGPLCLIKSINGNSHQLPKYTLEQKWEHRPDILFIDKFLPQYERDLLLRRANAVVSLHRAEGLGLTLLEAMAAGKPCLATNYSGNLEFMNPKNSWLIPAKPTPIGSGSLHYPADHFWVEPDYSAAAQRMREILEHPHQSATIAQLGCKDILRTHSLKAAGQSLIERLHKSSLLPTRAKSLTPAKTNHRAAAYEALASVREIEQRIKCNAKKNSWIKEPLKQKDLLEAFRLQRRAISMTLRAIRETDRRRQQSEAEIEAKFDQLQRHILSILHSKSNPPHNPGKTEIVSD